MTVPATVSFPKVAGVLSEDGELLNPDDNYGTKADRLIQQLAWYTTAIKNHKALVGEGPK